MRSVERGIWYLDTVWFYRRNIGTIVAVTTVITPNTRSENVFMKRFVYRLPSYVSHGSRGHGSRDHGSRGRGSVSVDHMGYTSSL